MPNALKTLEALPREQWTTDVLYTMNEHETKFCAMGWLEYNLPPGTPVRGLIDITYHYDDLSSRDVTAIIYLNDMKGLDAVLDYLRLPVQERMEWHP